MTTTPTPAEYAKQAAVAMRRIVKHTGMPPETVSRAMAAANDPSLPADLPPARPEWRDAVGRRACRRILYGLEPQHWPRPEFDSFRELLEMVSLTDTPPERLWQSACALLRQAAAGRDTPKLEDRLVANGLTGTGYWWLTLDLRDSRSLAARQLETAAWAVDQWPGRYACPHPERLAAVARASGLPLNEMQCELTVIVARQAAANTG